MNPFIESTVARPLPKSHHDQCWASPAADAEISGQSADVAQSEKLSTAYCQPSGIATPQPPSHHDDAPKSLRRGGRSLVAAFGLGVSLVLSTVFSSLSTPAAVAGMAAAGLLLPRVAQAIDLNQATAQDLQTLNGIGPKTAAMIVDERTRGGNFASLSDLSDRVRGIGVKKAAALQAAGLKVASTAPAGTAAKTSAANSSSKKSASAKR